MRGAAIWRRVLKALHEIAAIGVGGGLAASLVIAAATNASSAVELAAARHAIAAVMRYLLVPSLAGVLVTGLLAIAATRAYLDAGWAWLKALLGLSVFEATLVTAGASGRLAEMAAAGSEQTLLASLLLSERNTLLMLLGLSIANVVLAIWRPRLTIKVR